ncbi:ABC transporter transmembrane domain-containing protein [Paracoccaceae bacterium]|jgi:ATP-binding cassette subfamily B protein|nr:ABC transporter transmembrane domain-containing protein [Paracoccaceae bacterium]
MTNVNAAEADPRDRSKSRRVSALKELWPFLKPYKLMILAAFIALTLTAVVSLILPLAVRRVVDTFSLGNTIISDQYFVAAIGIAGLLSIGTALRYALVTRLGERVVTDIRKAVFARVIHLSPQFFEKIMTGEVLSRITTDTTVILSVVGSSISIALRNVFILIGGMILMLLTSLKLTSLVFLIVPAIVIPILVLGRRLRVISRENQDWIAASSGNASEALMAVQTVQAFSHENLTKRSFDLVAETSFSSAKKRIITRSFLTVIVIFLVFSGVVGVLWMGARDVRNELMSVGMLVQFVIYSIMVAGAVAALSEIWSELQRAAGATERLIELLNIEDTVNDPIQAVSPPIRWLGEITFSDITFAYPTRTDEATLSNINLNIKPGETVALVGPSGAGKSTFIQLLQRFYDPDQGEIFLDGIDIKTMNRLEFRKSIALVPQDPVIFAATVMENIRFGNPEANDEEVYEAARSAAAHDFISELPKGYSAYVGERGVMLSGGQKQRVAIARAILRNAPVLLLDEATSALDAENERSVQKAFDHLSKGRTTIVVAHRLATVKKADKIIVLDKGKIVAHGNHDKLISEKGLYARLASLQFTHGVN